MRGSIQAKSGKYYAVYRLNGKQKWEPLHIESTPENKEIAKKAMESLFEKYENGIFADYLQRWLKETKALLKPSTWDSYQNTVNSKIDPYFRQKGSTTKELKPRDFTQFFIYLKEKGMSEKTVKNIRGILSSAYNYAIQNDEADDNPVTRSRLPSYDVREFEPVIYSPEQMQKLLHYAEQTENPIAVFLFLVMYTGARKGEILGLTWDNVNFEQSTIHICKNRTGSRKETLSKLTTPKTRNGIRTIPLPPHVMDILQKERERQIKNRKQLKSDYKRCKYDYVIRKEDGSEYNPNSVNRIIYRMMEEAGLPKCRVHDFRHAVATILFENHVPIKDITIQLGHGQTSTTEKLYIHNKRIADKHNMEILSDVLAV